MTTGLMSYFWEGLLITVQLTIYAAALGLVFAFAAGLGRLARSRLVRGIAFVYTEAFRGLPALVLLFWLIFVVPAFGIQLNVLFAGVLALALNIGAYAAEVVRGAVQSVPEGQVEAGIALNFTPFQRMRKIILPQAIVAMIPPFSNNLIELLKATALVSTVYLADLTFAGQLARAATGQSAAIFLGLLVAYGAIALVFITIMRQLERIAARRLGRDVAPGPIARQFRSRVPAEGAA